MSRLRGWAAVACVALAGCTSEGAAVLPTVTAATPAHVAATSSPHATPTTASSPSDGTWFDDSADTAGKPMTDIVVIGGVDVEPGLYRVREPVAGDGGASGLLFDTSCKYGLYRGTDRGIENLEIAMATDGGHPVLDVGDEQAAYSTNCGRWERVSEAQLLDSTHAADHASDGTWTVGIDLAPGIWRWDGVAVGDDAICAYQVDSDYVPQLGETLDVGIPDGATEVTLVAGQRFHSADCGAWHRVGA